MTTNQKNYIPEFYKKIIKLEAKGITPDSIMIVAPSVVEKGEMFDLKITVLDKDNCACFNQNIAFEITDIDNEENSMNVVFTPLDICITKLKCISQTIGFKKYSTILNGKTYYSNPVYITESKSYDMLWGDPHLHTTVGDCHPLRGRTRNLAYTVGRYVYHFNWMAITDHVSWDPRGTVGKWKDNVACADLFYEEDSFTTIMAYETSMRGGKGGDNNVYFKTTAESYIDPWPDNLDTKELCNQLDKNKEEYFIIPHHTTRKGKHGEISNDIYPGQDKMPMMEIHSKWGTSEYRDNPTPLKDIHQGPSYAQDMLKRGLFLGFIGGSDSHSSMTFNTTFEHDTIDRNPGITCVLSEQNTREDIFDALKKKSCYATSGERIFLDMSINNTLKMGQIQEISPSEMSPTISVQCATSSDIEKIEIISNNNIVFIQDYTGWNQDLTWKDDENWLENLLISEITGQRFKYYYIRVTATSGARAWSSPIWFVMN